MVVSSTPRSFLFKIAMACSALALAAFPSSASAQTSGPGVSSSSDYKAYLTEDIDGASLAAAPNPAPSASAKPQYGQGNSYPSYQSRWSHIAFEAGGGFNAPVGHTTNYATYGGNLTLGAGWNFNKWLGTLVEYQFMDDKIPGRTLAAVGAPGGNVHVWSFTVDPIVYLPSKGSFGAYFTGGGGFYRKVTTFTSPQAVLYCDYFGFCYEGVANVTIGHFSSNQGGMNIGTGFTWKAFGPDSNGKLFAEVRYVWVDSPSASATQQGTGSFGTLPVTFGVRW
jgi:hypothetical protein